jgi:hypothetical protein
MKKLSFVLFLLVSSMVNAQMYSATYTLGDISGPINFTSATPTSCPGTLVINNIPNGNVIDSVVMTYNFFTTLVGFQSVVNQRSYVACPTFAATETQLTLPVVLGPGTIVNYNRRVTIADGQTVNGPLTFIMYAGSADPLAFASCSNLQNVIMNGTWVVNVYTSSAGSSCELPTALQAPYVGHDSAQLSWTQANASINSWQVAYGLAGTPFANYTVQNATATSMALSGLQQASNYMAFTRAICSPSDTSPWSAPVSFTTDTMPCLQVDSTWWFKRGNTIAAFYWTPLHPAASMDFEYGLSGFIRGTGTMRNNLRNDSVRITNLQGLVYEYYLRTQCDLSQSNWMGPFTFSMSTTSVQEQAGILARFYPQPVREALTLELQKEVNYSLRDLMGRELFSGTLAAGTQQLQLGVLTAGVYWLDLKSEGQLQRIKVIFQP